MNRSEPSPSILDPAHASGRPSWLLVYAIAVAQVISWGTIYYSFAVLVGPMQRDLGWSKPDLNGALSLGLLVNGVCALPIGAWIDRHGGRALMTLGSLAAAALLFAWSRVESLLVFYLVFALLGMVMASILYEPAFAVIRREFGAGFLRPIVTVTLFAGFSSTVFIPLIQFLNERLGWRSALEVVALVNLLACAPLHFLFVGGSRARSAARAASAAPSPIPSATAPLKHALRTATFWGLLVSFATYSAVFSAITFHIIPLLSERGVDPTTIVSCIALVGPVQVVGRLAMFGVGARLTAGLLGSINVLLLPLALLVLLLVPTNIYSLGGFAAIYGLGVGLMTIVRSTSVPDLIGREGYGAINGALALPNNFASAAAPIAAAALWSAWQRYDPVLWVIFAGACLSAAAFWLAVAAAPKRPRSAP